MVPLLLASSVSSSRVVAGSDGAFLVGIAFLPGLFDVAFFFRSGSTGNGIFIFIIIIIDIGICHDDELGDITQLCRLEIVLGMVVSRPEEKHRYIARRRHHGPAATG